jgi:hypothetical protein
MTVYVAHMREMIIEYQTFVGKPEGKRQIGRPRRGWEHNVTIDLRGTGWAVVD